MKNYYKNPIVVSFWLKMLMLTFSLVSNNLFSQKLKPIEKNNVIPGEYIVIYKNNSKASSRIANSLSSDQRKQLMKQEVNSTLSKHKLTSKEVTHIYETVTKGFVVKNLSNEELEKLRKDEQIDYIVPNQKRSLPTNPPASTDAVVSDCYPSNLEINGEKNTNISVAQFGVQAKVTGNIELVNDGSASPTFACNPIINDLTGKIALIDRGNCDFSQKAYLAQLKGAIGVIIVNNNVDNSLVVMGGGTNYLLVTIPVISISKSAGDNIKSALDLGPVPATLNSLITDASVQCVPWGIQRVGGGLSGAGKRAWVVDTGIDADHPDLNINLSLSKNFTSTTPTDIHDGASHGTHVAGTIGALDNGIGVIGVAAGAEIVAVRVFNNAGSTSDAILIDAINYVAEHAVAADVVNFSLGGSPSKPFDDAVYALSLITRVVMSAGNDAVDANYQGPARINGPNLYTISAMDINDRLASFSNFGNAPVDYASPGVNILSTENNGDYSYKSGTSMAAPHFAGLLLLGKICSIDKITNDKDGIPDPIAVHLDESTVIDNDGDGFTECTGDLNDNDNTIYPGAPEIPDGKDNDGDYIIDNNINCPTGGVIFVNASASPGGDGSSFANAFKTLQDALNVSKRCSIGTKIWIAKGTYFPTTDRFGQTTPYDLREKTFYLPNNVEIYGGFAGTEDANYDISQRNFTQNPTVLTAEFQDDNDIENNSYHVIQDIPIHNYGFVNAPILDGLTISEGYSDYTYNNRLVFPHSYGGGVVSLSSNLLLQNTILTLNQGYAGGALANYESNVTVKLSQFNDNYSLYGGGIFSYISPMSLYNSTFFSNEAEYGGGIFSEISNTKIINSTFIKNIASHVSNGGAIYEYDSKIFLKNSIIWENSSASNSTNNITASYNIIQDWTNGGTQNLNIDPKFKINASARTYAVDDIEILRCSPAVNGGDPTTHADSLGLKDAAGNPRFYNNGAIDLGAYEIQSEPLTMNVSIASNSGTTVYEGQNVTLTASGADSYLWSTGESTPSISFTPTGTLTYTVTGTTEGCTMANSLQLHYVPLPVTLIKFEGALKPTGSVQLVWETTDEINNNYFELERSIDLKKIESIGKVPAKEFISISNQYQFTDENPFPGTSYYRLKQVDHNGETKKYNWISIINNQVYTAYPNPVTNKHFKLQLDEPHNAKISLFAKDGKFVPFIKNIHTSKTVEMKLPNNLAAGVYILEVEERANKKQYKIIVE